MKLAEILQTAANRIYSTAEAESYVGGTENLRRMRDAGFLVPFKSNKRDTQYDVRDLDAAIDRIKAEGWPD